ncbi:hypothetical protein BN903_3 [Halorubrum sp. AJ67]|nr:hypothetical protein BN903_3 [Halorubrum sp. AJ67]
MPPNTGVRDRSPRQKVRRSSKTGPTRGDDREESGEYTSNYIWI